MASFVEQATLAIDDKATPKIKALNKQIDNLFKNAKRLQKLKLFDNVSTRNINNATRAVSQLNLAISRTPRSRTVTFNVRQNGTMPNVPPGGRAPGGVRGRPRNIFFGGENDTALMSAGRIIARAFVATIGFDLRRVVDAAGRSARESVVTIDTARLNANVFGIRDVAGAENAAFAAAQSTRGVSAGEILAGSLEAIAALQVQLDRGALSLEQYNERVRTVTRRIAETSEIAGATRGSFANGATDARAIERSLPLTNAGADLAQQQAFTNAIANAIAATQGDITGEEVRRTLQQLGATVAQSLSPEGLARVLLIRDEGGRQSTAEVRTAIQDLIRGSLNDNDTAQQEAAGLRRNGVSVFNEKDLADPIGFVEREIIPRLQKLGVDLSDSIAVTSALDDKLGFTTSGARFLSVATTQVQQFRDELERFRGTNARDALSADSVVASVTDVNAAFQDLVARNANIIVPAINTSADAISSVFEKLTRGEIPSAAETGGIATAAIASSFAALVDPTTRPLATAAIGLNGSAVALTAAATALTGAAAAQGFSAAASGGGVASVAKKGGFMAVAAGILSSLQIISRDSEQGRKISDSLRFNETRKQLSGVPPELRHLEEDTTRNAAMDSFLNFDQEAERFRQSLETGGQTASSDIQGGFMAGANALTGGLAGAFAAGADLLASRITGAINNAVINAPRVSGAGQVNTGTLSPTE